MEHVILYSSILLCIVCQVTCGSNDKNVGLSDCDLIPLSVYNCETYSSIDFTVTLKTIDDDGNKALDIALDLVEPLTSSYKISLKIDMYNYGSWQEDIFNLEDDFCDFIDNYMNKIWRKLKEQTSPPITLDCGMDPGYYELHDFKIHPSELEIPVSMYGRFRVEAKILYPDERVLSCFMTEVEIDAV